jgi:hypothetical protein
MTMSQNIHRQKLFGGRHTAEEVHQKYAFPLTAKCGGCGARPLTRALVMMEIKEAMKNPAVQALAAIGPAELMPHIVQIKDSTGATKPYFRVSVTYACKRCTPAMEKQLAKAPSHCIVEINRGPGVDKVVTSGRRH